MTTPELAAIVTRLRDRAKVEYLIETRLAGVSPRGFEQDGHLKDAWDRANEIEALGAILATLGERQ